MPTVFFTYRRRQWMWDTRSGELLRLSELEAILLAESPRPMPPVCPTAVRYAAAKFDSGEVNAAYAALRARLSPDSNAADEKVLRLDLTGRESALGEAALRTLAAEGSGSGKRLCLCGNEEMCALARSLGYLLFEAK